VEPDVKPQHQRSADLAVSRRQRLVHDTLQVVRDSFDPARGLERAARAAAAEVALAEAALAKQEALSAVLSQPHCPWKNEKRQTEDDTPSEATPFRSLDEQRAACESLARHRERPKPPTMPFLPPGVEPATRTLSMQQQRCAEMAQAKLREPLLDDEGNGSLTAVATGRWREQLLLRAAEPACEVVEAARSQLAEMVRRGASERNSRSRPGSASALGVPKAAAANVAAATLAEAVLHDSPEFLELRTVVEELLWVALLQQRSCPKASAKEGSRPTALGGASAGDELAERLENLLVDAVGPALRPVARKVLAPGARLARQARVEFPRLAAHLGFRESEDMVPAPAGWTRDEVLRRTADVRACRDRVLGSELTKILSSCQA